MIKPCLNPGLPRVILVMAPDIRIDLGKSIPPHQGTEMAIAGPAGKFIAVVTDIRAELIDDDYSFICTLQKL